MAFTSTVFGAIATLKAHFGVVASENPTLDVGVYVGPPIANVQANYLAVGLWPNWDVLLGYKQEFRDLATTRKNEDYTIPCHLRTWAGDSTGTARFTEAFTLLDGVLGRLAADPKAGGAISSSGTWQVDSAEIPVMGPLEESGFGVIVTFNVHVFNVTVPSF